MAVLDVAFEVPKWVEVGVRTGELRVFGGVVRNSAGQIVYMLREASRGARQFARGKIALVALAVAVILGAILALWTVLHRRKAKTLSALESVETKMAEYLRHARERELSRSDVEALATALNAFLDLRSDRKFGDIQLKVPADVYEKLTDFLRSLEAFNEAVHQQRTTLPEPPAAASHGGSLEPLLNEVLQQVRYQELALEMDRAA